MMSATEHLATLIEQSDLAEGASRLLQRDRTQVVEQLLIGGLEETGACRGSVFDALRSFKSKRVLKALFAQVGKKSAYYLTGSLSETLGEWSGEEYEALLREGIANSDEKIRAEVIYLLELYPDESFKTPLLITAANNDKSIRVRIVAIECLGRLEDKTQAVKEVLLEAVVDDHIGIFMAAYNALDCPGCLTDEALINRLGEMCKPGGPAKKVGQCNNIIQLLGKSPLDRAETHLRVAAWLIKDPEIKATLGRALKKKIGADEFKKMAGFFEPGEIAQIEQWELADEDAKRRYLSAEESAAAEEAEQNAELDGHLEELRDFQLKTKLHGLRRILYMAADFADTAEPVRERIEEIIASIPRGELIEALVANYAELTRLHNVSRGEHEEDERDPISMELQGHFALLGLLEEQAAIHDLQLSDEALAGLLFRGLSEGAAERLGQVFEGQPPDAPHRYSVLEEQVVIEEMGRHDDPLTTKALIRATKTPRFEGGERADDELKVIALEGLSHRKGDEVRQAIERALRDEEHRVRLKATTILLSRNEAQAVVARIRSAGKSFALEVSVVIGQMARVEKQKPAHE